MTSHDEDPKLQLELQKTETPKPAKFLPALLLVVAMAGVAVVSAGYLGLQTPAKGTGVVAAAPQQKQAAGDDVSIAKRAEIDGVFSAYTARLAPLDAEKDKAAFMASPLMTDAEKSQLWAQVETQGKKVTAITLWDNFDEDGDTVSIQSEGVTLTVPLRNAPTTVYIPYKPGGSMTITGIFDGGGGITAAIETLSGAVPLPIMSVGQSIVIPLL